MPNLCIKRSNNTKILKIRRPTSALFKKTGIRPWHVGQLTLHYQWARNVHTNLKLNSFDINRDDERTWNRLIIFLAVNAISMGRQFTGTHERAVCEMLHYDIPRHLTDARRIERWLRDNAENTISRYMLFR